MLCNYWRLQIFHLKYLTSLQKAERVYSRALRSLARYRFLKRSASKDSFVQKIREWLGERIPDDLTLLSIGESIALQNGLRRFINPSRKFVADVPASYREFRKTAWKEGAWYATNLESQKQLGPLELDAIVLLMLKVTRELLGERFVGRQFDESRFAFLRVIADEFKAQILVDEATDFSPIQLACMECLTALETRSFFACGDFNQRITRWGTRTLEQISWISGRIDTRTINTVYRQSRILNEFSSALLRASDGDSKNRGQLPEKMNHTGVAPALLEQCVSLGGASTWLSERIREIERMVNIGQMPTVAVLVNSESEVKPMAEALNELLEDVNLRAVACREGQSLGEGTDVRVFDVRHIKGLEFEAVFFVGIDALEKALPDLFGKYLYVGATRAATYLGVACFGALPQQMESMRPNFCDSWTV